jgi:formylglycine-generating enzyme required for sulfatase activity
MTRIGRMRLVLAVLVVIVGALPANARRCSPDTVKVGPLCVDKYEASVWEIPPSNTSLIRSVERGRIRTPTDMAGATQRGATADDYGAGCPDPANGCKDFYAVSVAGVIPARFITWFQAAAACRNAGKRLLTNQEWQVAALGTPDPGTDDDATDCNIGVSFALTDTGSRSSCVSDTGAFDMVGNVQEWVADWGDVATTCTTWPAAYGTDYSCAGGDGSVNLPGAIVRGGFDNFGTNAGVFAINGAVSPSLSNNHVGFRCARAP